jgi:hypothetical protein
MNRVVVKPEGFNLTDTLASSQFSYRYVITAVGKNNNESEMSEIAIVVQPDGKWQFYKP